MASSLTCLLLALLSALSAHETSSTEVPAVYVFGDSIADVGNNNYLSGTQAKANYPHYGIDLPQYKRPTGRFSNGHNVIDILAIQLGFTESPPPYLALVNKTIPWLGGVNYASGGSGILDSTGDTITMTKQIQNFKKFKSNLATHIDTAAVEPWLSNSLFIISSGGNDVFAFFAQNNSPNSTEVEQFIATLSSKYMDHIKVLYGLGARKFALIDVAPIGCCPYARAMSHSESCIDGLNDITLVFNNVVKDLVNKLSSNELTEMRYSIVSAYQVFSTIVANPNSPTGQIEVKTACCGAGTLNAQTRCNPNTTYCEDRGNYLFWDMLHPSHATAEKAGLAFYNGSLQFASPVNIKQLVEDEG